MQGAATRRAGIVGCVLLTALIILVFPGTSIAASSGWSEPTRVSTTLPTLVDWFPSVAADNADNVYIVWNKTTYQASLNQQYASAGAETTLGQLSYTRWNGSSWTPEADLALIWSGYALRSALAVSPDEQLEVVYKGYGAMELANNPRALTNTFFMSAPAARAASVQSWSDRQQISNGGESYFSDIAIDRKGVIHVIWTESYQAGHFDLFYVHSGDGGATWSDPITLSGEDPVWWYRAHLKIDGQDHLHVVWETDGDGSTSGLAFGVTRKAVYAQSVDGGLTWTKHEFTEPTKISAADSATAAAGPQQPVIGIDGNGTLVLVYRDYLTDRILYRQSADGSNWSAPTSIPGIASGVARPYDIYDTATDSAGHVHLVVVGYPTGSKNMSVLHSEWNGQAWTNADVVGTGPPYPEYPRITVGDGNRLHVVWFGGDSANVSRTPDGIWYSTTTTSAPRADPMLVQSNNSPTTQRIAAASVTKPTPTPVIVVPTPEVLRSTSRTSYVGDTAGADALLRQPALPIAASIVVACLVLVPVLLAYLRNRLDV